MRNHLLPLLTALTITCCFQSFAQEDQRHEEMIYEQFGLDKEDHRAVQFSLPDKTILIIDHTITLLVHWKTFLIQR